MTIATSVTIAAADPASFPPDRPPSYRMPEHAE